MTLKGRFLILVAFLPLLVAIAPGCQKGNPNAPAKVTGKVTYKGSPLTGGNVAFHTKDAGNFNFSIGSDGTYNGTDLPVGDMVVTVETESINPNKKQAEYKGAKGRPGAAKGMEMSPMPKGFQPGGGEYVKIPEKYADKNKSGLSVKLNSGTQVKDIALTD